jgi:hypothetical protein
LTDSGSRASIELMRLRRPITLLAALAAVVIAAPSASAGSVTATTSLSGAPDPVTAGHTAAFTTSFANGPAAAHDVEVRITVPAGGFVDAIPTSGACDLEHAHQLECEFGVVAAGADVSATVLVTAPGSPGSPGTLDATVRWSAEGRPAEYLNASLGVVPVSPDDLSEWVLPQGGTVTTDPGTGATTQNPQVTTAEVPATAVGTETSLSEDDAAPGAFCAPYQPCFGQVSTITIGQTFTPGDPLRLVFILDKSEIPKHTKIKTIPMYHDSVPVPNCTGPAGVAAPDPCVVSRKKLKKGDVETVVLSSTNGRWRP